MNSNTLKSLGDMISVLDRDELIAAEKMLAARRLFLDTNRLLTIPIGAEVTYKAGGKNRIGYCLYHNQRSIVVRDEDGMEYRVDLPQINMIYGEPWK